MRVSRWLIRRAHLELLSDLKESRKTSPSPRYPQGVSRRAPLLVAFGILAGLIVSCRPAERAPAEATVVAQGQASDRQWQLTAQPFAGGGLCVNLRLEGAEVGGGCNFGVTGEPGSEGHHFVGYALTQLSGTRGTFIYGIAAEGVARVELRFEKAAIESKSAFSVPGYPVGFFLIHVRGSPKLLFVIARSEAGESLEKLSATS
jgi:hypothetical protein